MNFCYADESGTGSEKIAVMVGVVVDSGRMHLTKRDWAELLGLLNEIAKRPLTELHTSDFYRGNGPWRGVSAETRISVTEAIVDWLIERKHHIVCVAAQKDAYFKSRDDKALLPGLETLWRFLAVHLVLAAQRYGMGEPKNTGQTTLVFDNEEREQERFIQVIKNPPEWTDRYYARKKNQERLDQIIDVPYFSDSTDVPLLQVADFLAYFLRLYAEIEFGSVQAGYDGEREWLANVASLLASRSIGKQHIYPALKRADAHDVFLRHAPVSLLKLAPPPRKPREVR